MAATHRDNVYPDCARCEVTVGVRSTLCNVGQFAGDAGCTSYACNSTFHLDLLRGGEQHVLSPLGHSTLAG
jgi:hypothetical protein